MVSYVQNKKPENEKYKYTNSKPIEECCRVYISVVYDNPNDCTQNKKGFCLCREKHAQDFICYEHCEYGNEKIRW